MSGVWTVIGGIVGLIVVALAVVSIVDVFRSDLSRGRTAAWVIVVLLLPLVGSLLYWALRRPSGAEIQYQADAERALREDARRRPFDSTGFR
jgi:hypothetical protein